MAEAAEQAQDRRVLRWDGTVTAGNILTASAMLMALLVWGLRLESRVEHGESRIARLEVARERNDRDTGALREVLAELRANQAAQIEALRRLERSVESVFSRQAPPR